MARGQRGSTAARRTWLPVGAGSCWLALGVLACGGAAPQPEQPVAGPPVDASGQERPVRSFAFEALDGSVVTSGALRGRMTVIAMVASYDDPSQAQAQFLRGRFRRHAPRINALAVVLEPEENRPLVETFAEVLDLPFPVVWADAATVAGQGPFTGLQHVPSVVLLDREGREVWRHIGLCNEQCIEQALQQHE